MAVYTNDLRLKEIATGDEAGTWGNSTNTNLQLIADAFGFGTEAITTNADTHTTTIADGSADAGRAIYLKYTGTLDSACTITIGPNTVSKLWFIENATSGSQNIIIKQGSGATVTIPAGDTKAIYSDGAGSGGAMVDAFASLNVVDLKVEDDLTVTDDLIVNGDIDLEGSIDVNGTTNLDVVDIDGALTQDGGAVFNEASADVDFRVESNGNQHMLFVDGGNDHVNIGTSTDHGGLVNIETTDNGTNLLLVSTDTDANAGPILVLYRQSASSAADGDAIGKTDFLAYNDANQNITYAQIAGFISDASDGSEDGQLQINLMSSASSQSFVDFIGSTGTVFNEGSVVNLDFRIESDSNTHMLFVDAGSNTVSVGSSVSDGTLHVESGSAGTITSAAAADELVLESSGPVGMSLLFDDEANDAYGNIYWGNETDGNADGRITYFGSTYVTAGDRQVMSFRTAGTERMRIKSGKVSIGTTAVASATSASLHVADPSVDVQAVFGDNLASIDDPQIRVIGRDSANSAIRYLFTGLDADANNGFIGYNAGSGSFVNALTFDTSGQVGIGRVPNANLDIQGSASGTLSALRIRNDGQVAGNEVKMIFSLNRDGSDVDFECAGIVAGKEQNWTTTASTVDGFLAFRTIQDETTSEKMRLDSSGDFSVGTTSPVAEAKVHVEVATSNPNSGSPTASSALLINGGTTTAGNGPVLALRNVSGSKETIARLCAETVSGNNGDLTISTYGGGSTVDERMRILGDGRIFMGTTTNLRTNETLQVKGTEGIVGLATANGGGAVVGAEISTNTAGGTFVGIDKDGVVVFKVAVGGNVTNTNNSYGAISDQKVKENIADASSQWDDIKAVRVRNYSMIADKESSANRIGVVAQELESAGMGGLVETKPDIDPDTLEDLGTTTKSVKYSVLYMKAIKALQEAMEKIETLETKVAALEGGS